jgi:hypothetical protein
LQSKAIAIDNDLRGTLRNFGLKVGMVGKARFEARIRELVENVPDLAELVEPLLVVRRALREQFVIPTAPSGAILLEAVKVRLGYRDEGTDFQRTKKPTKEKDAPPCINFLTTKAPYKGLGAESEKKHEPASDIDTAAVDSLKALDSKWPIREADIRIRPRHVRFRLADTAIPSCQCRAALPEQ